MKQYALKAEYLEAKAKKKLENLVLQRFINNGPYCGTLDEVRSNIKLDPDTFSRTWLKDVLDGLSLLGYLRKAEDGKYWTHIYYIHFPHKVD